MSTSHPAPYLPPVPIPPSPSTPVGDVVTTAQETKRPSESACICGQWHSTSSEGFRGEWLRNWCGTECCWTQETCIRCGRTYAAKTGVLLSAPRRAGGAS